MKINKGIEFMTNNKLLTKNYNLDFNALLGKEVTKEQNKQLVPIKNKSTFKTLSFEEKVELFNDLDAKPNVLEFPIDYKNLTNVNGGNLNFGTFYLHIKYLDSDWFSVSKKYTFITILDIIDNCKTNREAINFLYKLKNNV